MKMKGDGERERGRGGPWGKEHLRKENIRLHLWVDKPRLQWALGCPQNPNPNPNANTAL